MKKLTIKDFLLYNGPCFNCKIPVSLKLDVNRSTQQFIPSIIPQVFGTNIEFDIPVKKFGTLKLKVDAKTNKFRVGDSNAIRNYLLEHKLSFNSQCSRCFTSIVGDDIDFNIKSGFIHPFSINYERLHCREDNVEYHVYTRMQDNKSQIVIRKIDSTKILPPSEINIPAIPLSKFRTKELLLKKLKMYLLFS